jgi:AmmeMemoRadiSam system protein B
MNIDSGLRPRLRAVEVIPTEHEGRRMVVLRDPSGLAEGTMTVSDMALFILSRFDGEHTLADVQREFSQLFGKAVKSEQLEDLARQLEEGHFLEGPAFDAYVAGLVRVYREAPTRQTQVDTGLGVELHQLPIALRAIIEDANASVPDGRLVGLIAPHLDLRRGWDCYADAYGLLGRANHAERFVVLGTNHAGSAPTVVATRKDFETPIGTAATDRDFIERLSRRCGIDLCEFEFDHKREHSVEMQVFFLQYAFYRRPFRIVPVLCPDACAPTDGEADRGPGGVVRGFAEAIAEEMKSDRVPTCIIAGADLSHVGRRFGDDHDLNESFLKQVEETDRRILRHVATVEPEAFRRAIADDQNSTRVCSTGSIYALLTALTRAYDPSRLSAHLLRYHQAVDPEMHAGVTCAAVAFTLKT